MEKSNHQRKVTQYFQETLDEASMKLQCDLPAKASTCRFLHFLPASPLFTSILPISPNLPFLLRLNMSAGHQVRNMSENYRIFSDLATVNNFAHKMQGWVERVRALVELAC